MNKILSVTLCNLLRDSFGVYSGNWTEKSVRVAGNVLPISSQIHGLITKNHPPNKFFGSETPSLSRAEERYQKDRGTGRGRANSIYGHWLLPNGELTGQLKDHGDSALKVLQEAIPGYQTKSNPIVDLMNYSGAIRVRHAPPTVSLIDTVHQPTPQQLQKISEMARNVENNSGNFMWSALKPDDTGSTGSGNDYESLVNWKLK